MSDSSSLTSVAIIVVGWAITHLFSEARERRKEMRSQIDKLHDSLYKLEEDAKNFHCSATFNDELNNDIITQITTIQRRINRIFAGYSFSGHIISLRKSITLRNFDRSDFSPQERQSDIIFLISNSCQNLEDAFELVYKGKYPDSIPFINLFK